MHFAQCLVHNAIWKSYKSNRIESDCDHMNYKCDDPFDPYIAWITTEYY